MIRRALLASALLVAAAASLRLYGETRYVLRAAEPVAATLARGGAPVSGGVVFVFQPRDCFGNGDLLARWDGLHRAGRFPVLGLVVGDGTLSEAQRVLFRERGVAMRVRGIDTRGAEIVAEKLGYTSTPFAVVLDREGRVTGSFPAGQNVPPEVLEAMISGS